MAEIFDAPGSDSTIDGTENNDRIVARDGNDEINAGGGADTVFAGRGDDTVDGGAGDDQIFGGLGDDVISGGSGDDAIFGGFGTDVLRGGTGSDYVNGGNGDDRLIYNVSDNAVDEYDDYVGGRGSDTLVLEVTAAQAADPVLLAEIAEFEARGGLNYLFTSLNLRTRFIENIELVIVDGSVDPEEPAPLVVAPESDTVEENATVTVDVAENDSGEGTLSVALDFADFPPLPGGSVSIDGTSITFDPGTDFDDLGEGQQASVRIPYRVTDEAGQSARAVLSLTVTGTNDGPVVAQEIGTQSFDEDTRVEFTVPEGTFTDVDDEDASLVLSAFVPGPEGAEDALPEWLTFDPETGTFAGDPPANFDGEVNVAVRATDSGGLSAVENFTIDLTPVGDDPDLNPVPVSDETTVSFDGDGDGDILCDPVFTRTLTFAVDDVDEGDTFDLSFVEGSLGYFGPLAEPFSSLDFSFGNDESGLPTLTATYGVEANGIYSYDLIVTDSYGLTDTETGGSITIYDEIQGGEEDNFYSEFGDRFVRGDFGGGDDDVVTTGGFDILDLGAGNDVVNSGRGQDVVSGGSGDDDIFGGSGNDELRGEDGADILDGGPGDDMIFGGDGDDIIIGGSGVDTVTGGAGADEFIVEERFILEVAEFDVDIEDGPFRFSQTRITDFETGTDKLVVETFGFFDFEFEVDRDLELPVGITAQDVLDTQTAQDDGGFRYNVLGEAIFTDVALALDDIEIRQDILIPIDPEFQTVDRPQEISGEFDVF